jgi:hypothetical protein
MSGGVKIRLLELSSLISHLQVDQKGKAKAFLQSLQTFQAPTFLNTKKIPNIIEFVCSLASKPMPLGKQEKRVWRKFLISIIKKSTFY